MAAATHASTLVSVAQLSFDGRFNRPDALAQEQAPAWVTKVTQQGGGFLNNPGCWAVAPGGKDGAGRLEITLDRKAIGGNLIATVLFEAETGADLALQLFDAEGRAVVLDLFGNLVDVGKDATTDTFIIPLQKYPTAEKIVLRRISGGIKVYGMMLYPAVAEGEPVKEALQELARTLGDPLSPENPLIKGLQEIARNSNVTLNPATPQHAVPHPAATTPATPAPQTKYEAAVFTPPVGAIPPAPALGLVGHWTFQNNAAADSSGRNLAGKLQAGAKIGAGPRGSVLQLRKSPVVFGGPVWDSVLVPHAAELDRKDALTVSAWINYTSIAEKWGSQIVWYGDEQLGRDPWQLSLNPDGTLAFRSDRSVTGRPVFTVFENEIALTPAGRPVLNQHVTAESPGKLQAGHWYFVTGTMERTSPRGRTLRLYVNGTQVDATETEETINYETSKMWMTIGGADFGNWQNFHGQIADVRVFDRPLTPAEVKVLYQQPWK